MAAYDAIIVGAGQAGPALAGRLTAAGWTVALVERKLFGGTCANTGCTPTKALVASAYAAQLNRRAEDFGVAPSIAVMMDMRRVRQRIEAIVTESREGVEQCLRQMERCTIYQGAARFVSPSQLRVGGELLTAPHIFLNVGSRPAIPNLPGIDTVPYLTSSTILALDSLPPKLAVVGGGYAGLEFAQIYRRFGSEVTVIQRAARLIADEDEDVSNAVREILEAEGIEVHLNAECVSLRSDGDDIAVRSEEHTSELQSPC